MIRARKIAVVKYENKKYHIYNGKHFSTTSNQNKSILKNYILYLVNWNEKETQNRQISYREDFITNNQNRLKYMYFKKYNVKQYNKDLIIPKKEDLNLIEHFKEQKNFIDRTSVKYGVDITKYKTLSTIGLNIFLRYFLKTDNLGRIEGKKHDLIRSSFMGGLAEIYKTYGKNLYYYDINSQYPSMMQKDMPLGGGNFIEGKIKLKKFFGFQFVRVETIKYNSKPFQPIKLYGKTYTGLGKWTGWYFSEELKKAEELGFYKITPQGQGIEFERGKIFEEYVKEFFELKSQGDKTGKLQLNTQYGIFGVSNKLKDLSGSTMINGDFVGFQYNNLLNIAISAAISSYGRIEIDKYRRQKDYICHYSDTDSVIQNKALPKSMIGKNLGQMKQEAEIEEAIFTKKKVYCYKTVEGNYVIKTAGIRPIDVSGKEYFENAKKLHFGRIKYQKIPYINLIKNPITGLKFCSSQMAQNIKGDISRIRQKNFDTKPININKLKEYLSKQNKQDKQKVYKYKKYLKKKNKQ